MKSFKAKFDVCIPNEILQMLYNVREKVTKAESMVIIDILQRGGNNHTTPISYKQLSIDCNMSEKSVQRALKHLEKMGIVSREYGNGFHAPSMISIDFPSIPFTQVPASAIQELMNNTLSQTAIRILFLVWRYSYGFKGKNGCVKSFRMSDTFITIETSINEKNAQKAIKELKEKGAINTFINNSSRFVYPCDTWVFFQQPEPVNFTTPINLTPPPP